MRTINLTYLILSSSPSLHLISEWAAIITSLNQQSRGKQLKHYKTKDLHQYNSSKQSYIVLLWHGCDVHCLFLCCGQLECAFAGVGPSLIDLSMPLQRWAWLKALGPDFDCTHM